MQEILLDTAPYGIVVFLWSLFDSQKFEYQYVDWMGIGRECGWKGGGGGDCKDSILLDISRKQLILTCRDLISLLCILYIDIDIFFVLHLNECASYYCQCGEICRDESNFNCAFFRFIKDKLLISINVIFLNRTSLFHFQMISINCLAVVCRSGHVEWNWQLKKNIFAITISIMKNMLVSNTYSEKLTFCIGFDDISV